jgi:hypothetical protein
LVLVRVERGKACPGADSLRAALRADRRLPAVPASAPEGDIEVTGPFVIRAGDREVDEYVVWER